MLVAKEALSTSFSIRLFIKGAADVITSSLSERNRFKSNGKKFKTTIPTIV